MKIKPYEMQYILEENHTLKYILEENHMCINSNYI